MTGRGSALVSAVRVHAHLRKGSLTWTLAVRPCADLDNGLPPQRWVLVAKKLAVAAVFLGIHLWGYDRLNFNITLNSSDIAAARASVGGFCMHVARVYAAGFFVRCMFYTVSFCTDAISIVAGFGYRVRLTMPALR